jgi:hypothetical protein
MNRPRITRESGLSLIVTLVVTVGLGILIAGILCFTSTQTTITRRVSQYDHSVAAGIAATEKVLASISRDFQRGGEGEVYKNLVNYRTLVPTPQEVLTTVQTLGLSCKPDWGNFQFSDAAGQINQTSVQKLSEWGFRDLQTRFTGLRGYAADYRVISRSRQVSSPYQIVSAIQRDVQVASVPVFQYQLFYVPDMEIHPSGPGMSFNGRVHCNGSLYCKPEGTITFQNYVTTAGKIIKARRPDDPVAIRSGWPVFRADIATGVNTLNVPTGLTNTPTSLRALIEAPPFGELPGSLLGQQRFYNKADLLVLVTNGTILVRSGIYNGSSVIVPWAENRGIVSTGKKLFYDKRECKDNSATELDLAAFLANYNDLFLLLGRPVKMIWIVDSRPSSATTFYGIRLLNCRTLPSAGLTIATPNPLYVYGHFNAPNLGATNTVGVPPACLAADSVTLLSVNWFDGNGPKTLYDRIAEDTTVNAAIITGIVPTCSSYYSGGVENALRILENWTGKTLTFNGALAVLYYSARATAPWGGPDVYAPPTRNYNYDWNFSQIATLPPGTPEVRTILRGDWVAIKPSAAL